MLAGRIVANASIPVVVASYGWSVGLYMIAAVVSATAVLWVVAGSSTPNECAYIQPNELAYLNKVCQNDDDDTDDEEDDDDDVEETTKAEGAKEKTRGKEGALRKLWKGFLLLLQSPAAMSVVFVALSNNWTQVTFVSHIRLIFNITLV